MGIYAKPDLDMTWQEFSNCLGVDPDLFFPERGASTREAKEVCRGCVVQADCLEYALQNGEKFVPRILCNKRHLMSVVLVP